MVAGKHLHCIIRSKKLHPGVEAKRNWLSDKLFVKKYSFEVVDIFDNEYELLALSFDGTTPKYEIIVNQNLKRKCCP